MAGLRAGPAARLRLSSMSRAAKTICGGAIANLLPAAEGAGLTRAEFMRRAGLTEPELSDPQARASCAKQERAARLLLDRGVCFPPLQGDGLEWVEERLPILASACSNAPTLHAALRLFIRFRSLISESGRLVLREDGERAAVAFTLEGIPGTDRYAAFVAVGAFDLLAAVIRRYHPQGQVRFDVALEVPTLPAPACAALVARFGGRLSLGAGAASLSFTSALHDRPFPGHNPDMQRTLVAALERAREQLDRTAPISLRVSRCLRTVLGAAPRGLSAEEAMKRVRAELRETEWTLRRQLAREGLTFKALLLSLRLEEARRLLADPALPVGEIAVRLGFVRQSSFTRFIRNALGESPLEYRRRTGSPTRVRPDGP